MTRALLQQFLRQECSQHVRGLLEKALLGPAPQTFEFNRFALTFDDGDGDVLLEDLLDPSDAGAERIPRLVFVDALRAHLGS